MYNRVTHKTAPDQVETDELMAFVHYVKVKANHDNGKQLVVVDVDHGVGDITITGKELIENAFSADQVHETIKVTKTQAAEILVGSINRPFTVCFIKSDGTERKLRGRLFKPEPLLGRSMVEDLDIKGSRLRQVDHRTIEWIVVEGVKYVVK
jgi:hypothetical protein